MSQGQDQGSKRELQHQGFERDLERYAARHKKLRSVRIGLTFLVEAASVLTGYYFYVREPVIVGVPLVVVSGLAWLPPYFVLGSLEGAKGNRARRERHKGDPLAALPEATPLTPMEGAPKQRTPAQGQTTSQPGAAGRIPVQVKIGMDVTATIDVDVSKADPASIRVLDVEDVTAQIKRVLEDKLKAVAGQK